MRQVIVTGGLGFIGSHLVDRLCDRGITVTVIDNLSSNVVSPGIYHGRCSVVTTDVADLVSLKGPADTIFHLASIVGPLRVLKHPGTILEKTLAATRAVVAFAETTGAHLIFFSSSEIYGKGGWLHESAPISLPISESPRGQYALAKLRSEQFVRSRAQGGRLRATIIRPFNVAGPRQSHEGGFVVARFIRAALRDKPLTVYGDGTQKRSFVHVADIVAATLLVAEHEPNCEIFNVGNPHNVLQIHDLAAHIKALVSCKSPITFVDPHRLHGESYDDGHEKLPIIEKIRQSLGWTPRISIDEILADTVAYELSLRGDKIYVAAGYR